jgi:hypothetical protein
MGGSMRSPAALRAICGGGGCCCCCGAVVVVEGLSAAAAVVSVALVRTREVCEGVGGSAMLGGGTGGFTLMRVGIFTKKCFDARETRVLARPVLPPPPFFDGDGLVRKWSL